MSLLTAAEQRRRAAMRRTLFVSGALVLVVAISVAVTVLVIDDEPPGSSAATPQPTPEKAAPEDTDAGTWQLRPVSAGPLILPGPTGSEQGIPTGFPQTTEGAIGAAAYYAETSVGLDVGVAHSLGAVAGAPSYVDAEADFVKAVQSARAGLGLQPDGPTGGAYLTFQTQAYRVCDATPSRVDVAVLGLVDGAGPATEGQGRLGPTGTSYTLVWTENDWHIAGDGSALPEQLPSPRSTPAYEEGWRDLALG